MDDDRNRTLNFEEFKKGITEYGLGFSKDEITEIFKKFDTDSSGSVDFDEFLIKLRVRYAKLKKLSKSI
jgi:Ca2+-binding EF-hand superfamily protein